MIRRLYTKFRNVILYGIIGCFSSATDACVFYLLSDKAHVHYMVANYISVLVGIGISFMLNRTYNFKVKDHTKRRFMIFMTVGLCGFLLSNLILYTGIEILHFNTMLSKLISIVLVVGFQFILNKLITFKK